MILMKWQGTWREDIQFQASDIWGLVDASQPNRRSCAGPGFPPGKIASHLKNENTVGIRLSDMSGNQMAKSSPIAEGL